MEKILFFLLCLNHLVCGSRVLPSHQKYGHRQNLQRNQSALTFASAGKNVRASGLAGMLLAMNPGIGSRLGAQRPSRIGHLPHSASTRARLKMNLIEPDRSLLFPEVVKSLKADIPQFFHNEPHWSIFEENVKIIDQNGTVLLEGLWRVQLLWKLVHEACKIFSIQDDINIEAVLELRGPGFGDYVSRDPFVRTRWNIEIDDVTANLDPWDQKIPLHIEAEPDFHLNEDNKVYKIEARWLINGRQVSNWPSVSLMDEPAANLKAIDEWVRSVKLLQPVSPSMIGKMSLVMS